MRRGHVAIRTCRGCGRKAARSELKRLVLVDDRLTEDARGDAPGRGIYCCKDDGCRQRLMKSKKIRKRRTKPA
ncbi:MAG: DUF448 domain-containing protein [Desulfobulbus sp.]|jgi:predicted RNA-binding protein YlxR (DUF448 family)